MPGNGERRWIPAGPDLVMAVSTPAKGQGNDDGIPLASGPQTDAAGGRASAI